MSDPGPSPTPDNDGAPSLGAFVQSTTHTTASLVTGDAVDEKEMKFKPLSHGAGTAIQSISQSVAIAVQDASDLMRDIATVETTAIGIATKKMIEEKNPLYIPIIEACQNVMIQTEKYWLSVGKDGAAMLSEYSKVVSGDK